MVIDVYPKLSFLRRDLANVAEKREGFRLFTWVIRHGYYKQTTELVKTNLPIYVAWNMRTHARKHTHTQMHTHACSHTLQTQPTTQTKRKGENH